MQKYFVWIFIFIFLILLALGGVIFYFSRQGKFNLNFNSQPISQIRQEQKPVEDPNTKLANLYNTGKFSELNQALDNKLDDNQTDFTLLLQKANTLAQEASLTFKEKELGDKAMTYVDKALTINASSTEALTLKGYIYEIQQDYVNAHKYYDQALKIDPNNVTTIAQKAHAYDLQGKLNDAYLLYGKAYKLDSKNEKVLTGYARILAMIGLPDKSEKILLQIISNTANTRVKAETYYLLGTLTAKQTEYSEQAMNYYQLSIDTDSTFAQGYVGKGRELFKKFLASKDKNADKHILDESMDNLSTALKINPNLSTASLQLALQTLTMGDKVFARKVLLRMQTTVPNDITSSSIDKKAMLQVVAGLLKKTE